MATPSRPAPAIPPLLKDLNERAILETIRAGAPISRAEISRRAGISKPTVSVALQSLLEAGLVREATEPLAGPRYGAVFFEPVPDVALVLALDLGARFLRGAICDLRGDVRARQDVEIAGADAAGALDAVVELRDALVAAAAVPTDRIDGAVIGVPGVVGGRDGQVHLAEALHGLEGMAVADELGRRLGVPVTVENDINLAAVGEQFRGVARGVEDFAFLSVGTGLGAGLMLRGELHRGHHGAAGEVDFASAGAERDVDPCARAVSALAERLAAGRETALAPPFEVPAIFGAARAGDAVAREVVAEEARRIAVHIASIAAVADPSLVVLGGGLGVNGDLLLEPIRGLLAEWLPYPPRVEVSGLGEAAIITGALGVGLRSALDNVFLARRRAA
jgi:predicted NBD/HSP70 family sugar kinase/DNA-binding CsgD family transcriptional regulator